MSQIIDCPSSQIVLRHRSVSLRAWSRNCSSSAPRTGRRPPAMAGVGRFFQERMTSTTRPKPKNRAAKGMIYAARSKPFVVGAARTVGPYFWTKACSTRLSLSPRETAAISSLRMPSESGQPTWLHSRRIWLQPQMHIIWWPISVKRVAGSPAPRKAKMASDRRRMPTILWRGLPLLAKDARNGVPGFVVGFEFVIGMTYLRALPSKQPGCARRTAEGGCPHICRISLLWLRERHALALALLAREHGPALAHLERGPERYHRA